MDYLLYLSFSFCHPWNAEDNNIYIIELPWGGHILWPCLEETVCFWHGFQLSSPPGIHSLCLPSLRVCAGLSDLILTNRIWQSIGMAPPCVDCKGSNFQRASTLSYSQLSRKQAAMSWDAPWEGTNGKGLRRSWAISRKELHEEWTPTPQGEVKFQQPC